MLDNIKNDVMFCFKHLRDFHPIKNKTCERLRKNWLLSKETHGISLGGNICDVATYF